VYKLHLLLLFVYKLHLFKLLLLLYYVYSYVRTVRTYVLYVGSERERKAEEAHPQALKFAGP
jgi:hypothetical protein